jgi:hypothetical protein
MALVATAVSLTLAATPVLAQTFNGYDNQDPAVTQGYAPYQSAPTGYNGFPVVGPVVGLMTAPFTGFAQPAPGCFVDRDFNGRYTAMCGL